MCPECVIDNSHISIDCLVEYCSPTLAGIKTGSLFTLYGCNVKGINKELCRLNRLITSKGLRAVPVKYSDKYSLIYIYRPEMLSSDLKSPLARKILKPRGYSCESCERCVKELVSRLSSDDAFPHEIGLFLGYPPEDVKGFIDDPNHGVKCVGFWKVYGDVKAARQRFASYKKCTECYRKLIKTGKGLSYLIA